MSDILSLILPTLERMAAMYRQIKVIQDVQLNQFAEDFDRAQSEVDPVIQELIPPCLRKRESKKIPVFHPPVLPGRLDSGFTPTVHNLVPIGPGASDF
jgi:hypothetical protein